jgi:hypothetical protein
MQGRTVRGADVCTVKREFVRVTGLPVSVADDMFGGMPKVVKRQARQADAERIAATLRAIGAAATVELENENAAGDETDQAIEVLAALGHGPPTVVPGSEPPQAPSPARLRKAWVRDLRDQWPILLGSFALLGAAMYFAPEVSGFVSGFLPAPEPAATVTAPAGDAAAQPASAALTLNASLLHGPWRCVDQRTGLGDYWSYAADGALVFHGDVLSDRPAPNVGGAATRWRLNGDHLLHTDPAGEVNAYNVAFLSLSRLRYLGDRGLEIECRRP